jgi:hypothetical protein
MTWLLQGRRRASRLQPLARVWQQPYPHAKKKIPINSIQTINFTN